MTVAVSIIVPCYNVAPYLDACLDSLVNQTMPDIEIICVNDGSTDDTPALLSAWAGRDSRVRVIDRENGDRARPATPAWMWPKGNISALQIRTTM